MARPRPQPPSAGTPNLPTFRYVVAFSKRGAMRFTGHLDLQRSFDRTLRRADAPLSFTKGFHPRPRLRFAAALPLGFTSEAELCEVWLTEEVDIDAMLARMQAATPPGMEIASLEPLEAKATSLAARTRFVDYAIALPDDVDRAPIAERVAALLGAEAVARERRGKPYDLRPLVESLAFDGATLTMRLACRSGATGRPDEVLRALDIDETAAVPHRTAIVLAD